MAVSTTNGFDGPYTANGVTTSFPFTFTAPSTAEVAVLLRATDGTETTATGYTVTLGSGSGGTVVFAAAPTSGVKVIPYLDPEFTQEISFDDGDAWLAAPVNEGYDRSAARDQALKRDLARAGLSVMGEAGIAFPASAARVGKYLAFDASGNAYPASGTGADGALRDDLASANGPALVAGAVAGIASITLLAALAPAAGLVRYVTTGAAKGWWQCVSGSTPTDTLNGLYKASNTAGYYWARVWDGINGKPEWFGALRNNNNAGQGAANLAAFHACRDLCPVVVVEQADYWTNGKLLMQTPNRVLRGVPGDGYNTSTGTRIISTDLANAVVRFGPDTQPATTPEFMRGIGCYGITFMHSAALTAPALIGDAATATATIERQWLLKPYFEKVNAWEPLIGFRTKGVVQPSTKLCKVLRTSAAAAGADFCWGLFLDGGVWASGLPGNPSYFDEEFACEFAPGLSADKVGLLASGDFSDIFIEKLETVNATSGIRLFGSGTRAQVNAHLRGCVIDQCSGTAVDIKSLAAGACVTIEGGYFQAKATATAVIHVRGTNGTVNITGGAQILGNEAGTTIGVYGQEQQVLNIDESVSILECPRPVVVEGATNGKILCTVQNDVIDGNNGAISIQTTGKMRLAPTVRGKANAFLRGIQLVGTSNTGHTIDPTLVLASAVSGAANKVVINPFVSAIQLIAPGYYTAAGGAGASGAGLHVTGITA